MCLFNKYQIFNLSHFNFPFEDSYSPESEQFTFVYIIVELPQVATKVILLQNILFKLSKYLNIVPMYPWKALKYIPCNHTYCSINRTATTIPTNTSISVVWLWLIELYKLHPITAQFVHRVITLIFLDPIGSLVFTWWVFVIVSK